MTKWLFLLFILPLVFLLGTPPSFVAFLPTPSDPLGWSGLPHAKICTGNPFYQGQKLYTLNFNFVTEKGFVQLKSCKLKGQSLNMRTGQSFKNKELVRTACPSSWSV